MGNIHLPFRIRWAGDPMPDILEFAEPLAIPFRYVDASSSSGEGQNQQLPQTGKLAKLRSTRLNETRSNDTSDDRTMSSGRHSFGMEINA